MKTRLLLLLVGLVPHLARTDASDAATFQPLGAISGARFPDNRSFSGVEASSVADATPDSRVLVGRGRSQGTDEFLSQAIMWTAENGLESLPGLHGEGSSHAVAISDDGSIIVGASIHSETDHFRAVMWGPDRLPVDLGDLGINVPGTVASDVASDGSLVVGSSFVEADNESGYRQAAFRWTADVGMVELKVPGAHSVRAYSITDAGLIVGDATFAREPVEGEIIEDGGLIYETKPVIWDLLGDLADPGTLFGPELTDLMPINISADFSVVVGRFGNDAYRWTADAGLHALPPVSGSTSSVAVRAMSPDGLMLVGQSGGTAGFEFLGPGAVFWTEDTGTQRVQNLLEGVGLQADLEGWFLVSTSSLSDNGRVLSGIGINPDGIAEGWVASVPEPRSYLAWCVIGALILMRRHIHW